MAVYPRCLSIIGAMLSGPRALEVLTVLSAVVTSSMLSILVHVMDVPGQNSWT